MSRDYLLANEILNAYAYDFVNSDISEQTARDTVFFYVAMSLLIVLEVAVLIWVLFLNEWVKKYVLKQSIFSSLFLKK